MLVDVNQLCRTQCSFISIIIIDSLVNPRSWLGLKNIAFNWLHHRAWSLSKELIRQEVSLSSKCEDEITLNASAKTFMLTILPVILMDIRKKLILRPVGDSASFLNGWVRQNPRKSGFGGESSARIFIAIS